MRRFFAASLLAALAFASVPARAQSDLGRYRDRNRVLIVFAPSPSDARWKRQDALLRNSQAAFAARDLVRLDVFARPSGWPGAAPAPRQSQTLRRRFRVKPTAFRVFLIGKDGHTAFGGPSPVSVKALNQKIDAMPMRREEMRRRGR